MFHFSCITFHVENFTKKKKNSEKNYVLSKYFSGGIIIQYSILRICCSRSCNIFMKHHYIIVLMFESAAQKNIIYRRCGVVCARVCNSRKIKHILWSRVKGRSWGNDRAVVGHPRVRVRDSAAAEMMRVHRTYVMH